MAGYELVASMPSGILLSADTEKAVLAVWAPANPRPVVKVRSMGVFFEGVSSSGAPVQIRAYRATTSTPASTKIGAVPKQNYDLLYGVPQTKVRYMMDSVPTADTYT